jgi:RNA polymerase sigma-70 factor (ECF subfamily)
MTLLAVETDNLAKVEDACKCVVSARPTFPEVLAHYQDVIYRYALHLTGNRVAADEVYQETVLTAYHEFDRLDGSANHRAWLYRIATDVFLSNRRQRSEEGARVEERTEFVPAATVAARGDACSLVQEVQVAMERLPLKQRIALIQRKYHDFSYTEIAASLRCSEAIARTSAYQALRTLRTMFEERL